MAKVKTGVVRLSYVYVEEPKNDMQGNPFYSAQLIIKKDDKKTITAFKKAVEELKADPKVIATMQGKTNLLHSPLRDGDTDPAVEEQQDIYGGCFFVNTKNKKRPALLDRDKNEIEFGIAEEVYSGVYAQVVLSLYAYNINGNRGVGVGLNGIRKVKDGDRLGGVVVSADDFDDDFGDDDDDLLD